MNILPPSPEVAWLKQPLATLRRALLNREISCEDLVREGLASAAAHPSAFICLRADQALAQAQKIDSRRPSHVVDRPLLEGIPISVKDNFDLRGTPTTCGSSFYAQTRSIPRRTASFVQAWQKAGGIVLGKTHLNEFAYGLTGENAHWGDCRQPQDPEKLTGGSSSGAAASVQAGSVGLALGTDTGGSLRVPAALCQLVSFRQSAGKKRICGLFPLALSYDTCGWLQRHLSDLSFIARALQKRPFKPQKKSWKIGFFTGSWLDVCAQEIHLAYAQLSHVLSQKNIQIKMLSAHDLHATADLFSALQASEAAHIHQNFLRSYPNGYEPAIRQRLDWGQSFPPAQMKDLRQQESCYFQQFSRFWAEVDLLVAPACPVTALEVGKDHSATRRHLLQMTAPFSLPGLPALTFPWGPGVTKYGWQVLAPWGQENRLISFSQNLTPH